MKKSTVTILLMALDKCVHGLGYEPVSDTLNPAGLIANALIAEGQEKYIPDDILRILRRQNIGSHNYLEKRT